MKNYYITTTLPYVNAELHMGHALEFVRADAIARYHALLGDDVFFNSGTDEHGSKIYHKAHEMGVEVQSFVDQNVKKFYESVKSFGIMDGVHFIRTTDEKHVRAAEEFWKRVNDNGYIYKKNYQAKYCVGCESEKTESELVDGKCPDHPNLTLELIDEENYFFKFSAFQKSLLEFYEKNPNFVIPDFRFNEMKSFVERGLQDFSISRQKAKMPWGIPVPDDEGHTMYVWFDALVNYIATLGWPTDEKTFEKYWREGTPVQYCGKDNNRFQSAIWQAMLMACGLPNSHTIVINGFITADGGLKMSKSLGNVADPKAIAEEYGTDALRFFLLSEVSSFEDSPFTEERFKDSYNAKLANGLGNLSSRILTMAENYGVTLSVDKNIFWNEPVPELEAFTIDKYMARVWTDIQVLDKKIQTEEPFKLFKIDPDKAKEIVSKLLSGLYVIAQSLAPVLPETSLSLLGLIKNSKKPEKPLFLRKE